MAPPNLAMQTELVARSHQRNVVPFDNHRQRLRLEYSRTGEPHPRGVVVRLPLPAEGRTLESRTNTQPSLSDNGGDRLTPIDCIVAFLLFLSTLTGPAVVWLLSF
jgi:hypothetical protein